MPMDNTAFTDEGLAPNRSARTERQIEQTAQEVGHHVVAIRTAIAGAKALLDGGNDPVEVERAMIATINGRRNRIDADIAGEVKPVAQALAERYGVHYLKKHTSVELGKRIAADLVDGIMRESEDYRAVTSAASTVRIRADHIEEAGRTLRYWASEKFVADDSQSWRMSGDSATVEAMLKHWGKVYCQARGLDGIVVYENDTDLGTDTVEEALERVGHYALHRTLAGMGRFGGESSLMQIRLGELMGHIFEDHAHKTVVRMTLGALTYGEDVRTGFDYDDASEYQPGYRTGGGRTAFDRLEP